MPVPALSTMAKKAGVSLSDAERYWNDAKISCKGADNYYACVMGVTHKRLGLKKGESVVTELVVNELLSGVNPDDIIKGLMHKDLEYNNPNSARLLHTQPTNEEGFFNLVKEDPSSSTLVIDIGGTQYEYRMPKDVYDKFQRMYHVYKAGGKAFTWMKQQIGVTAKKLMGMNV